MWCEHCRQDVTGMVSQMQDSVCCTRCGSALPGSMPGAPLPCPAEYGGNATIESPIEPSPALPRPDSESWDIEEDLRHIGRLLRRDETHRDLSLLSMGAAASSPPLPAAPAAPPKLRGGIAWLLLCAGLAATACGLMLLAWHFFAHRADLLIPGLACAAAGQLVLLCGFLIQPSAASDAPPSADASPPAQWLEVHRRIDKMLRADLPGETDHQGAYAPRSPTSPPR